MGTAVPCVSRSAPGLSGRVMTRSFSQGFQSGEETTPPLPPRKGNAPGGQPVKRASSLPAQHGQPGQPGHVP